MFVNYEIFELKKSINTIRRGIVYHSLRHIKLFCLNFIVRSVISLESNLSLRYFLYRFFRLCR